MSCFWINYVWWFVFSLKLHLFHEDNIIKNLWNDLALFFENDFSLFDLTMQAAFVGFLNADLKLIFIQNHLLLLSKIYIYNTRRSESLILKSLIREVMKVKTIKRKISVKSKKKKKLQYVLRKMAASWNCFEEQNNFQFCLIFFYNSFFMKYVFQL